MAGTPHQLSNSTHANDDRFNGFESNELRRVSAPIPNEFGPGDSRYAKSQSMAFGSGRGIRDEPQMSQQIRQQSDETIRNMAKSQSMPFSRLNERSNSGDSIPSRDKRSSPMDTQGPNRGYGGLPDKVTPPPPVDKTPKQSPRLASAGQIGNSSPSQNNSYKLHSFDNIVELIAAQPQKTYVASPPELEMILARTSAGGQPKQGQPGSATNDWDSVWLQLSGISLSMWSMKETRAAAAKGEKVPPTYFNITDSSLELLAPLPPPPHRPNSHPHHFVFSLNTAGSNRLLFSCPTEKDVAKWATGLRLAAWERARLEEIYTGHLIKSEGMDTAPSQLVRGRMEGWVRVRVMGGTDWKRLWVVLSTPDVGKDDLQEKKNRRRSLFGIGDSKDKDPVQEPNTGERMASFYLEQRTQRNQTSNTPVLTITNVSQAYAVFPERLEVMSQSNLMKVVGRINGDLVTIEGRLRDSGWALIMPEAPDAVSGSPSQSSASPLSDMMRWVTGFHDVFELYGRPGNYSWDVKDPKSLFFAYPQGERRGRLFLDIDEAMRSDFRTSNLPAIRGAFRSLVERRLLGPHAEYRSEGDLGGQVPQPHNNSYRLPPLAFDKSGAPNGQPGEPRSLTPITERTDIASRNPSTKTEKSTFFTSDGSGGGQHRQVSNLGEDRSKSQPL
ncbi:hypothetical protein BD324DRAFT_42831 [Kockovaella imperatae]|uniref:PH domain-containing protein n=1 Tax=Kockovaella imperatae TaxID=4999 RepID=A0A1Y1USW7_9TREE|nr:hypothetical protein BD324DRAFT_42831 [Kockovaella imperatae]ORX41110.1 hypothetical protein BD324DRAFT_42831 [Kockovaella imperatae]